MKILRNKLQNGQSVFGTWCMLPSSFTIDVIAQSGIDFVVIDLEHGSIDLGVAEEMVRTAQLHGCQPIIRVGDNGENTILHALETGCEAVFVPHVATVADARKVVNDSRYPPFGKRGLSPYTRCHRYDHEDLGMSLKRHAEDTIVGVLVEGEQGIGNLPAISEIEGIDIIYLGVYDISQSIGLAGQLDHPRVLEKIEQCLRVIVASGKVAGTFARTMDSCIAFREMGFRFVAYVADSYALKSFFQEASSAFHR